MTHLEEGARRVAPLRWRGLSLPSRALELAAVVTAVGNRVQEPVAGAGCPLAPHRGRRRPETAKRTTGMPTSPCAPAFSSTASWSRAISSSCWSISAAIRRTASSIARRSTISAWACIFIFDRLTSEARRASAGRPQPPCESAAAHGGEKVGEGGEAHEGVAALLVADGGFGAAVVVTREQDGRVG